MGVVDLGIEGPQHLSTKHIKEDYKKMLEPYKARLGNVEDGLTSMPFMEGSKFKDNVYNSKAIRILFVGRAVNGWEIDFQGSSIDEIVEQVFESAFNMSDISAGIVEDKNGNKYNYNKSPFFQLCHKLMNMYGLSDNWSQRMAWTNLYKIAPYKSGNPNNKLISETLSACATILRKEISYLQPTHIVLITDAWWYKPNGKNMDERAFINEVDVDLYEDTSKIIVGSGISKAFHFEPKVVITKRPEGVKITREEHARAIFDALESLA